MQGCLLVYILMFVTTGGGVAGAAIVFPYKNFILMQYCNYILLILFTL